MWQFWHVLALLAWKDVCWKANVDGNFWETNHVHSWSFYVSPICSACCFCGFLVFTNFPQRKTSQFISHFVPFLASSISYWFRPGWGNFGRSITVSSWITLCSDSLGWGTETVNGLYNNSAFHITVYPFALLRHWVNLYASAALPALQCLRSFSLRHSFAQASGLVWACLVCSIFKLVNGGLLCQSCWLHGPLYSTQGIVTRKTAAYWIFEFFQFIDDFLVFVCLCEVFGICWNLEVSPVLLHGLRLEHWRWCSGVWAESSCYDGLERLWRTLPCLTICLEF